jgi:hypothetical protein
MSAPGNISLHHAQSFTVISFQYTFYSNTTVPLSMLTITLHTVDFMVKSHAIQCGFHGKRFIFASLLSCRTSIVINP